MSLPVLADRRRLTTHGSYHRGGSFSIQMFKYSLISIITPCISAFTLKFELFSVFYVLKYPSFDYPENFDKRKRRRQANKKRKKKLKAIQEGTQVTTVEGQLQKLPPSDRTFTATR